ncbi:flagellar hook-associated protein FlgL [Solimonas marina]|uniref:Flagellar hook-associated protein FlgL n=1 Tax=Solimonas marina TaxID=2714601 RepID=A0A969W6V8_9GAMM|nr:flagellar hook-associated protein FlgL [Solimonas marina]NKF21761.1 flagellar hook-associated protein FlgL [Solimonas marina]
MIRTSTAWQYQQGISQMLRSQQDLTKTQNQLSSNVRWQTAADDPAGWAQAQSYDQLVAANARYTSAAQSAQQRLQLGEDTIASGVSLLQRVRELTIEANTSTQSEDTRASIAKELYAVRDQLMALANTTDGQGRYLFGGADDGSTPFTWNGSSADYHGDQTVVSAQIGSSRTVAQNDPGSVVFLGLKTGNGTFAVTASSANTGGASITSATLSDSSQWDGGSYTLRFTASDQYEIVDASNTVVQSGSAGDGDTITFRGASLTLSGSAAAGDRYTVAPSSSQDMFAMIDQIADLLMQPQDSDSQRAQVQTALQQAMGTLQGAEDRLSDVRSGIGLRLNAIDDALDVSSAQNEHAQAAASDLRDTDYADAISKLQLQMTTLQAAQQVYSKVQGLSLFNYL